MFGGGGIIRLIGLFTFLTLAFALGGATGVVLEGDARLVCEGVPLATLSDSSTIVLFVMADGERLPGCLTAPGGGGGGLLAGYFGLSSPNVV